MEQCVLQYYEYDTLEGAVDLFKNYSEVNID